MLLQSSTIYIYTSTIYTSTIYSRHPWMVPKGSRALFLFLILLRTVNTIVKLIPQFICTGSGVRSELCRHVYCKAYLSLFVTRFWAILLNYAANQSPRSTWCRKHHSGTIWSTVRTMCSSYCTCQNMAKLYSWVDQKTLPPWCRKHHPTRTAQWPSGPSWIPKLDCPSKCLATGKVSKILPSRVAARGKCDIAHCSTACSPSDGQAHHIKEMWSGNMMEAGRVTFLWRNIPRCFRRNFKGWTNEAESSKSRRSAGSCHPSSKYGPASQVRSCESMNNWYQEIRQGCQEMVADCCRPSCTHPAVSAVCPNLWATGSGARLLGLRYTHCFSDGVGAMPWVASGASRTNEPSTFPTLSLEWLPCASLLRWHVEPSH